MGMMNYAVNRLLERKDIFADFVNGVLFQGNPILFPENLELMSPNSGNVYKGDDGKNHLVERRGDIRMKAKEEFYSLIVIGETQDSVHYAMPIRIMEYVVLEYKKQIQDLEKKNKEEGLLLTGDEFLSKLRKDDKLVPVIAIVLYCDGDKEWDGSRSLYEMMAWTEIPNIDEKIKKYLPDFKLNIVQVSNLGNCEIFHTSLQTIFGMLKYRKDKKQLQAFVQQHRQELDRMDNVEALATLALLGQKQYVEEYLTKEDAQEGEISVCIAIEEMIRDGEMKGLAQGISQGIANVNLLFQNLFSLGRIDDFIRSTTDTEFQRQLFEEFNIPS